MCPQSYYLQYGLGHRGPSGRAATKGTIVHKVLEITALCKQAYQNGEDIFEDDVAGEVETHNYNEDYLTEIIDKVYYYYITHNKHIKWEPKDNKECHKWVWKTLQYNDGMFDPRNRHVVAAEPHFDFPLTDDWAKYRFETKNGILEGQLCLKGTIDFISDLSNDCYEVIDWKTGRRLDWATGQEKTYEKLEKDPQLRIYHLAAHHMYPGKAFIITIGFINHGGFFSLCFTEDDIPETKEIIKRRYEQIKATTKPELRRSWKCNRLCFQGMSTFEGTHIEPIKEFRANRVTPIGEYMTKCEQVKHMIELKGMDWVNDNYTKPGYSCSDYHAPGEVE